MRIGFYLLLHVILYRPPDVGLVLAEESIFFCFDFFFVLSVPLARLDDKAPAVGVDGAFGSVPPAIENKSSTSEDDAAAEP